MDFDGFGELGEFSVNYKDINIRNVEISVSFNCDCYII